MDINNLRSPSAILKMVELLLLIIIMALFFSQLIGWAFFVSSVFVGCFLNAIVFLANIFMGYDQYQKTPLELVLYAYFMISLFASAICLFTTELGSWITAGIFCLIIMCVYAADWYYAYVNFKGHPPPFMTGNSPQGASQPSSTQTDQVDTIGGIGYSYQNQGSSANDEADLGTTSKSTDFQTNPSYPGAMNYPPAMFPDNPPVYEPKV